MAKKIMAHLWKVKGAYIFHSPVDPIELKIEDYFTIIKRPMDFGSIKVIDINLRIIWIIMYMILFLNLLMILNSNINNLI